MSERKVTITNNPEVAEEMQADESVEIRVDDSPEAPVDEEEQSIRVEDVPDEETLWENGPSAGAVKNWKKQYGEVYVTSITFDRWTASTPP